MTEMTPSTLTRLAERVKNNSLDHRNPEKFYIEREEIWAELKRLAKEAEHATVGN